MENQGAHEGVEGLPPTTPAGITAASMRRMKSRNERSQPRDQHEILDMSDDAARAAVDLNRWMVGSGWAVAFRRYSEDYVVYEDAARQSRANIWSGDFDMPWDWRAQRRSR
jgi:hypothetical protein